MMDRKPDMVPIKPEDKIDGKFILGDDNRFHSRRQYEQTQVPDIVLKI